MRAGAPRRRRARPSHGDGDAVLSNGSNPARSTWDVVSPSSPHPGPTPSGPTCTGWLGSGSAALDPTKSLIANGTSMALPPSTADETSCAAVRRPRARMACSSARMSARRAWRWQWTLCRPPSAAAAARRVAGPGSLHRRSSPGSRARRSAARPTMTTTARRASRCSCKASSCGASGRHGRCDEDIAARPPPTTPTTAHQCTPMRTSASRRCLRNSLTHRLPLRLSSSYSAVDGLITFRMSPAAKFRASSGDFSSRTR